jgi:hypothetical protein
VDFGRLEIRKIIVTMCGEDTSITKMGGMTSTYVMKLCLM